VAGGEWCCTTARLHLSSAAATSLDESQALISVRDGLICRGEPDCPRSKSADCRVRHAEGTGNVAQRLASVAPCNGFLALVVR
jgi:hypothetical protein